MQTHKHVQTVQQNDMLLISYLNIVCSISKGCWEKQVTTLLKIKKKNSMTVAPCERPAVKLDGITAGRSRQSPRCSSAGAICLLTKRPHRGRIDCEG